MKEKNEKQITEGILNYWMFIYKQKNIKVLNFPHDCKSIRDHLVEGKRRGVKAAN